MLQIVALFHNFANRCSSVTGFLVGIVLDTPERESNIICHRLHLYNHPQYAHMWRYDCKKPKRAVGAITWSLDAGRCTWRSGHVYSFLGHCKTEWKKWTWIESEKSEIEVHIFDFSTLDDQVFHSFPIHESGHSWSIATGSVTGGGNVTRRIRYRCIDNISFYVFTCPLGTVCW